MIKNFPHFSKLKLEDKRQIESFIKLFPPYSDYNFTSLWTYNTDESLETTFLNGNLVIKFSDYLTRDSFYSFLGIKRKRQTIDTLINYSIRKKVRPILKLIPAVVIAHDKKIISNFKVKEDPDNHDYIVSAKEIALLPKDKFKRKRYLVERFNRKYPDHKIKHIDLKNTKEHRIIFDLFYLWEKNSGLRATETNNELKAIKRLLDSSSHFDTFTIGIFYSGKLVAFNIYEVAHDYYGISAYQKADKSYTGIYSKLSHEAAKHLYSLKCKFINYEQDLGIEGLRLSKSLWKPTHFLKKYKISAKK